MAQQRKVSSKPKIEKISLELESLNLISGPVTKNVFDKLFENILKKKILSGSGFINTSWKRFKTSSAYNSKNYSLNGNVFEGLLAVLFYRVGIYALFRQAKMAFIPNVEFDFVAYSKEIGPLVLSAKTSLRERYKQADLEGIMMRQVHRRAKSYLLTLNAVEAKNINSKIKEGKVLGIDRVYVASEPEFDDLVEELKSFSLVEPPAEPVVESSRIIRPS